MHELSKFQEPASGQAREAVSMLSTLRERLAGGLSALSGTPASSLEVARWLRDAGQHGGGDRVLLGPAEGFCTASLNISQVHYDDLPDRRLGSATALSCIVHPTVPEAPSMHMHLSWTEMKGAEASGSWRLMADLNPSHEVVEDTAQFRAAMEAACGDEADEARARGDAYFHIPALQRHRGAAHYYFERHRGVSLDQGREDARRFGEAAVDTYVSLLRAHMLDASGALRSPVDASDASALQQRAYHTLYLYQVLTLDRGTTSGVLVHDQNDEGILGSLPPVVDVALLRTWRAMTPAPQDKLLDQICEVLDVEPVGVVDGTRKRSLAGVLRQHYAANPEGLKLQAGDPAAPLAAQRHRD